MTAIDVAAALVIAGLGSCIVFFFVLAGCAIAGWHDGDEDGMCTPSRRATITASQPQARLRVVLAPIVAAQVARPLPLAGTAYDAETVEWVAPQPSDDYSLDEWEATYGCCTPSRYDVLTMQRRHSMTYDLAALAAPDLDPEPIEVHVSELMAILTGEEYPKGLPVAVEDWPLPAVVEPEPVPVVVGWTAARFSSLEIKTEV